MADGVSLSLFAFVGCLNTMGRHQAQAAARVSVEANRTIIREFGLHTVCWRSLFGGGRVHSFDHRGGLRSGRY